MHFSNSTRHLQIKPIFAVLGLIILSFAAYLNVLSNTFVFDDVYVISGNYFIRDWQNVFGLFTSKYFAASGELSYRPVVTLSYFVDYSLWHLNPMGYHLTNIVLHTLNSALLFFLVWRMVRNMPLAFLAATFFITAFLLYVKLPASNKFMYRTEMLHSVQHDSVCHSKRGEESKFYLYPLSLLSYLFALFLKEMAITLPLLIFFFDYLIGSCRTFTNRILRFYLGYILVTT